MKRHALRAGESLAIAPEEIRRDADGLFLMMGPETPANEKRGTVAVVTIRGALAQFKSDAGDSYEAILSRTSEALKDTPTAVVFRISSPGGVVAGLNGTVLKLRKMSADSKVPFIACVDEMAASAAYAMACACEEILAPASAIVGSVGVISTMVSVAQQDEDNGIEFRLITSGARKADGHLHIPISDEAVAAETARNSVLAQQFFTLASEARGLSPKKLASLQAAIYLGEEAKRVGLIDDVMSFDEAIGALDRTDTAAAPVAPNAGSITDRRAKKFDKPNGGKSTSTKASLSDEARAKEPMSVKLQALIAKMAAETDPTKLTALLADYGLAAAKSEKPDDDDSGDDDDDDGDEDDSKSKKAAAAAAKMKAKHEAMGHRAKAADHKAKAAELEEKAKKCEEEASSSEDDEEDDEEDEASSHVAEQRAEADASAEARASNDALTARVAQLEKDKAEGEKLALIDAAKGKRITPHQAKQLAKEPLAYVRKYIEMAPKSLVVRDDEDGVVPGGTPVGSEMLPKKVMAEIEATVASTLEGMSETDSAKKKELGEKMRANLIEARRSALATNGIAGRV